MKIYIGADHNGFEMKSSLVEWLRAEGHEVEDMGPSELDQGDDYPDYGFKVAEAVAGNGEGSYGILLCGSGVGMAVVANKVKGIRAATVHDPQIARVMQPDDNVNVLSLGASFIELDKAKEVIKAWLDTPFSEEERHVRRLGKIAEYEERSG